jgi:DNA-binding transcriptional MocR family regulator
VHHTDGRGVAIDASASTRVRDLASGNPDPALLPPLRPALDALEPVRTVVNNVDSVLPELAGLARERFARDRIPAESVAVCSGALDAMERVLVANVAPGARILVEDPGYPPVFLLLAALGLKAVPGPVDESGLTPDGLARTVADVQALIVTPRAQNPTGAATTPDRAAGLRDVLREHPDVLVIEDDHAGDIAGPDACTLVEGGRSRWAVIRSASKSLGADLRLALLASDPTTMAMVRGRQRRGPGWVSGLLQQIVTYQWTTGTAIEALRHAKLTYEQRRSALLTALAARGITASGRSGLNVWIPVADEDGVVDRMRRAGYAISAGRRFRRSSPTAVRITISTLAPDEAEAVADAVAEAIAARGVGTDGFQGV